MRHSNRSVELKSLPRDGWFSLLALNMDILVPRCYRSHRPRSVEDLVERLKEKPDIDVALGGINGARYYLPGIDLVGTHLLDLCVHNWSAGKIDKLIRKLDPALKSVNPGDMPQVVVHGLYRPESFYNKGDLLPLADEVECLLDLHEARLE